MSCLEQDKMISVFDVSSGVFKGCQRVFDHICPKCGEEIYHTFNNKQGNERIDFYTACDCVTSAWEQEGLEKLRNQKENLIKSNKERCGFAILDKKDAEKSFITHKGNYDAYEKMIAYARGFTREVQTGFFIHGPTGVGKSMLAKKVAVIVLNQAYSCYFTNTTKLLNDIKKDLSSYTRKTLDWCLKVDLLIIDDLGSERATDYDIEQLFLILETRWRDMKPIIFTSNLTPLEIKQKYNDKGRIYSRIMGTCEALSVDGKDMRIQI